MKLSVDNQQRVMAAAMMALEFYKVTMGTLLTLFVPQQCGSRTCSLYDNATHGGALRNTALLSNLSTFAIVLSLYAVEVRREDWCITYLDIDPNKSNNNLDGEIEAYPEIKRSMHKHNRRYLRLFYVALCAIVMNFGVSSASILEDSAELPTVTSLASFLILVCGKLYTAHDVGTRSVTDERAFSAYLTICRTYNTIDADHRRPIEGAPAEEPQSQQM